MASGTTTLELLSNFVAVTGQLPPISNKGHNGEWFVVAADSPEARLFPVTLRFWLHSLTCVMKFVEQKASWVFLPGLRLRKVYSLAALGDKHARSGVSATARFVAAERTAYVLQELIRSPSSKTLFRVVNEFRPMDGW